MGIICSKCTKTKNKEVKSRPTGGEENSQSGSVNVGSNVEMHEKRKVDVSDCTEVITQGDFYFDREEMPRIKRLLEEDKNQIGEKRQIVNYKKGSLLGEGSYGRVYQAFDEDLGQIIAVKEIDMRRITNNNYLEAKISSFQSEIDILSQLNHKNIVKYYGTKRTKEAFHIFLEFCIGGSISKMLDTYKFFTENVIKKYTRQILEGLEYLHAHNVIHRDIKGANILVERDGLCKLSDFGGAKVIKDEIEFKQQNSFKGTPNWMAPETVRNLEYTRFSDIWSIGCTVIEMATGEPPWAEYKNPMAALYNLMHTNQPPQPPAHLTDTCKHFISCCMQINPKERLNVIKLLKHPFIVGDSPFQYEVNSNINFEDLKKRSDELANAKDGSSKSNNDNTFNSSNNMNNRLTNDIVHTKDIQLESKKMEDNEKENKKVAMRIPGRKRNPKTITGNKGSIVNNNI